MIFLFYKMLWIKATNIIFWNFFWASCRAWCIPFILKLWDHVPFLKFSSGQFKSKIFDGLFLSTSGHQITQILPTEMIIQLVTLFVHSTITSLWASVQNAPMAHAHLALGFKFQTWFGMATNTIHTPNNTCLNSTRFWLELCCLS